MHEKRKRYAFYKWGFFALLVVLAAGVYVSYDYWVFKLLVSQHYVPVETLDTLYEDALGDAYSGDPLRDFDRMVISHTLRRIRRINGDKYTFLYAPKRSEVSQGPAQEVSRLAYAEALSVGVVYVRLADVSATTRAFLEDNREALAQYPSLVLDLRGNGGGRLTDFHRMAQMFVGQGNPIAYEHARWPLFSHTEYGRGTPVFAFGAILVLQDGETASAAEGLIAALSHNLPQVVTAGETTYGKGLGQVTLPLTGGFAVRATVLELEGPGGENLHKQGLAPDICAVFPSDAAAKTFARAWFGL